MELSASLDSPSQSPVTTGLETQDTTTTTAEKTRKNKKNTPVNPRNKLASDSDVKKHQPTKQKYSLNSKSMKNLSEMESNLCEKEQIYENLNMDAEEETEHLFLPTTTNYSETSQKTETKSLDEQSHMSLSPMLSRGKRNNSHFSNDLQLLIRDSYDGLEGTVERFIAVPVSPSLMAHQLQLIQSQTTNLENLSPSRTCTALVSAQIHASQAEPPPTYERLSPIGASVATSNLSLDKIYTADQL